MGFPKKWERICKQSGKICQSDAHGRSKKEEDFSEKYETGAQGEGLARPQVGLSCVAWRPWGLEVPTHIPGVKCLTSWCSLSLWGKDLI